MVEFVVVDNHSVSLGHVRPGGVVLDVGCRGFRFAEFFGRRAHQVICLDPAPNEVPPNSMNSCWYTFVRAALVGEGGPREAYLKATEDPEARHVVPSRVDEADDLIRCITLPDLLSTHGIKEVELAKFNCEGSEFDILDTLSVPIKQIVVSFHEHTPQARGKENIDRLLAKFSDRYSIYNAVFEKKFGCSDNYWNVVMVIKDRI